MGGAPKALGFLVSVVVAVVTLALIGVCAVAPAGAAERSGPPKIVAKRIVLTRQPREEVEVRASIETHDLPTTYEVWFLAPVEFQCEDLEGCPRYEPRVIETGTLTTPGTITVADEVNPHYTEEVWFVASNADGTRTSRHVKLSMCRSDYCPR
jgi:hypothetical protein